jgi:hypothetical protein
METPLEIPADEIPADAPAESPEEPTEPQPATPVRLLGLEPGDILTFCILIGFSAWLWSRASETLGSGAALLGAAIGLAVAFLVRRFC